MVDKVDSEGLDLEKIPRTFHEVLMFAWPKVKGRKDLLSERQREWIKAYLDLSENGWQRPARKKVLKPKQKKWLSARNLTEKDIPNLDPVERVRQGLEQKEPSVSYEPTRKAVAEVLGITPSASAQMRRSILSAIALIAMEEIMEKDRDPQVKAAYQKLEKDLSELPAYGVKYHGVQGVTLFELEPAIFHARTKESYRSRYAGHTITEKEARKRGIVIERKKIPELSPGQTWWKVNCENKPKKAIQALYMEIANRWGTPQARTCEHCKCLLPLGERVPDGKKEKQISRRSKYCSDQCKRATLKK